MNPLRNLKRRPGRSALTILGVMIAVIMLVVMLSISSGMQESTEKLVRDSGVDIFVTAEGGNPFMGGSLIYNGTSMAREMKGKNSEIREIGVALQDIYLFVSKGDTNITGSDIFGGYHIGNGDMRNYDIIEGEAMPHDDDPFRNSTYYREWNRTEEAFLSENFTHECMVSATLAWELEISPGDTIYISPFRNMSVNLTLKVYGVYISPYDSSGSKEIDMHLSEIQFFLNMSGDPVSSMYIDLYHPDKADEVSAWIEENYPLSAVSQEEFISQISRFMDTFRGFSTMISAITVLVGAIFIGTIMDIAVRERRREIAAMRAMGISTSSIVRDIFLESLGMILIAFVLGTIVGSILAYGMDAWFISGKGSARMPEGFHLVSIDALLITKVFLISMALGLLASMLPARWATRINISDALRGD